MTALDKRMAASASSKPPKVKAALPGREIESLIRALLFVALSLGAVTFTTVADAKVIYGTRAGDTIRGTSADDIVYARGGNDTIYARSGRDTVYGGRGSDGVSGGKGRDRIHGGRGPDTIHARDGRRDRISCGKGQDLVAVDRVDRIAGCERKVPAAFLNGPAGIRNVLPRTRGAFLGTRTDGTYTTLPQNFVSREGQLGRKLDVYHVLYGAPRGTCYATAPLSPGIESWAWGRGVYSFVSWSPRYTIAEVNSGAYDSCFRDVAQRFKAFGHPIWLRLWHEFNGNWMLWSYDPTNAQPFIDAWRRVVGIFQSVGADNTMFVWSPAEGYYAPDKRQVGYPGDAYVDWVASDAYNWNKSDVWCGPFHAGWCEFWEKFHHGYSGAKAIGVEVDFRNRKPYLVAETGTIEDLSTPGRKGQWMRNMRDAIKNEFPGLRMLLYSDFDLTTAEGVNWRVDTSQSSLDGFTALARDAYFNTRR
jgi:Glycosyl hydrolase family 26/RTX calcium-binding nonapeptide repeat (4 copies)